MNILEHLEKCSLFSGMSENELESIIDSFDILPLSLGKDQVMEAERGLYIICSGKIRVCKKEGGKEIFFKYLVSGDSFGYAKLFSGADYIQHSLFFIRERTNMIFISENTIRELIMAHPVFAINIISLLTDKVRFLNKKIDSFTAPTTESRLFKYLSYSPCDEDGRVLLEESMSELAKKLDMGRASLYRAFDSLEKSGYVLRKGDEIYLLRKKFH